MFSAASVALYTRNCGMVTGIITLVLICTYHSILKSLLEYPHFISSHEMFNILIISKCNLPHDNIDILINPIMSQLESRSDRRQTGPTERRRNSRAIR